MGKKINQLSQASQLGLDDYFGADINLGSGSYGTRKVSRRQILRQAELPDRTAPAMSDTIMVEALVGGVPTPYKMALSALPINVLGNAKWVDSKEGNDSSGRPYKTITAAKAAAAAGDTIIVGPGTYDEADLLKDGVNYLFLPGAVVRYTGSENTAIFWDHKLKVESKIAGWGDFIMAGVDATSTVMILSGDGTKVHFEFNKVETTGTLHAIWIPDHLTSSNAVDLRLFGNEIKGSAAMQLSKRFYFDVAKITGNVWLDCSQNAGDHTLVRCGEAAYSGDPATSVWRIVGGEVDAFIDVVGVQMEVQTDGQQCVWFHGSTFRRIGLPGLVALKANGLVGLDNCKFLNSEQYPFIKLDIGGVSDRGLNVQVLGFTFSGKAAPAANWLYGQTRFMVDTNIDGGGL